MPTDAYATIYGLIFSRGNYVGNDGVGPMVEWQNAIGHLSPMQRDGGVFYINSWLKIAEMVDGTSHTAMVSEIRAVKDTADGRGMMHYPEGPSYHHNYTPNSLIDDRFRTTWCVSEPDAPCIGTFAAWNQRDMLVTARSRHPGGVNLLLGDGSVNFVSETIDLAIWQALSTPKALPGEPVGGEF